jgi:hypothetical protein
MREGEIRHRTARTCTRRIGGRGRLGLDHVEHGVAIVAAQVSQLGDALL